MKKWIAGAVAAVFLSGMAACGNNEPENSGVTGVDEINMDPLEAELMIPETADPGDELTLEALVTQGEEKVDDASEVIFEVWIDGEKGDSDMVEAELPGEDGLYSVTYDFTEEAVYKVQPHVTARGQHVMPVGDIIVGDPEIPENEGENEEDEAGHSNDDDGMNSDH